MRMKLYILLFFFPFPLFAQEFLTISGTVTDASSGQPLPFALVTVSNTTLGSITNDDGVFTLTIPSVIRHDTLLIGFLGYKTYTAGLDDIIGKVTLFSMQPSALQLNEVEIFGLTAEEVLRQAVLHIPDNYGITPVVLTGYVRVKKTVNNRLAEFAEAIIEDYKNGYYSGKRIESAAKSEHSNIPKLLKARVTSDTVLVNSLGDVGKKAYCLGCYFTKDIAEYSYGSVMDEKEFKYYDYRVKELTDQRGKKVYHITFDQKNEVRKQLWKGEFYIDATTFAILKASWKLSPKGFEYYEKDKYKKTYYLRNTPGWILDSPLGQTTVTYAERDGKFYLSTITNEYFMTYSQPEMGRILKYGYRDDLVVTDATRDSVIIADFKGDKSIGTTERWDQIAGRPDPAFWQHYNFLPIEATLKKAIEAIK